MKNIKRESLVAVHTHTHTHTSNFSKGEKGITLIALIITIIVLLILARVSISAVTGDNGIINRAGEAAEEADKEKIKDMIEHSVLMAATVGDGTINQEKLTESLTKYLTESEYTIEENGEGWLVTVGEIIYKITQTGEIEEVKLISTSESYEGYYADVDGDGKVDGIIYIDLMADQKEKYWSPGSAGINNIEKGTYSWTPITSAKEYIISNEIYTEGAFGDNYVITLKSKTSTEADRFYVMALEDVDSSTHRWYFSAYYYEGYISEYASLTSTEIGAGKTNTANMITVWNDATYGSKNGSTNSTDIWGAIQEEDEERKNISR